MVEYITVLAPWAWPIVTLVLVLVFLLVFRREIGLLLSRIREAKVGPVSLYLEERKTEAGERVAKVTAEVQVPAGLSELQTKILQEFKRRGDYDTMNVSKNLIGDFRYLRMHGLLAWDREEDKGDQVSLTNFGVTEEGKKKV